MQNSGFMNLMRKIRDREVAVEGNSVVEQDPSAYQTRVDKGKGRELDHTSSLAHSKPISYDDRLAEETIKGYADMQDVWDDEYAEREQREHGKPRQFQGDGGAITEDSVEDEIMTDERFNNMNIINDPSLFPASSQNQQGQNDWFHLQHEWDAFEATATGIRPVQTTRQHAQHSSHREYMSAAAQSAMSRTVEDLEAETRQRPHDPRAWLALGIRHQENEREEAAIRALTQALELDPKLSDAWLAIAVSYTNENVKSLAYDAVERWIDSRPEYAKVVQTQQILQGDLPDDATQTDKHAYLTGMLISMATTAPELQEVTEQTVDADIQVALGVLFNASDEYGKAIDCLSAALAVRPDVSVFMSNPGSVI